MENWQAKAPAPTTFMSLMRRISPKLRPVLDPEFLPAALWNRTYRAAVRENGGPHLALALERTAGSVSVFHTAVLPHQGVNVSLNLRYVERLLKFLLWQKGGYRVSVAGEAQTAVGGGNRQHRGIASG